MQHRYVSEARSALPDGVPTTAVNNFVRDWGRLFIYDKATMTASLAAAGFTNITPFEVNQSDDPGLTGMENASHMTEGFIEPESMVFQAERPAGDRRTIGSSTADLAGVQVAAEAPCRSR